ncbi:hypothetical protein H2277_08365, partial [Campylobacter sp. W0014]|uniref:hypothetical protein n=1 Tax=Campylobacter sp. W0014 TaxID=2735781 RepID=UPI001EC5B418|nr:hypothetical protein [Campylobacter sp. W0014]
MNLILPVAGKSSRFPNMKPKWLLTHPNGNLMIIEAIKGLPLSQFKTIYVICLKEHSDKYNLKNILIQQFDVLKCKDKLKLIMLDQETKSQPETVYKGIKKANITGQIYIKDSDNFFIEENFTGNFISTFDLNEMDLINAKNKSYVCLDEQNIVVNIIEKKIISSMFNVGGYGFEEAEVFCNFFEKLKDFNNLYISHIIYSMMLEGIVFRASKVKDYIDWGTIEEWNRFKDNFATLFVDIDGTLVHSSSEFFSPMWGETLKIKENVDILNRLYDTGRINIVLTTSRSLSYERVTKDQLKREGIKYHQIIFGLYHAKRIIINDYASTNPYKSCDCVNLKRDSNELKDMLNDIFKTMKL